MNKEEEELQHLRHMETTIIPILVALGIVGLNFYIQYGQNGQIEKALTTYLLAAPMALAVGHLKCLISNDIKDRLLMFFFDAIFLITIPLAGMIVIINYGILGIDSLSIDGIFIVILEIIITIIILYATLFKKINPAFDSKIFPTLCKKYKILKYKKKPKLVKNKKIKEQQLENKTTIEQEIASVV